MKRNVEKSALKNSTIKAQATFFRNKIAQSLKDNGSIQDGDLPIRGPALLNMVAKLGFDFASWDALLRGSLNSNNSTDSDVYLFDEAHFLNHREQNALFLQKAFIPHVNTDVIKSALFVAEQALPKRVTRSPLTKEGRKLCYSLCEQHLSLKGVKHPVIANINGIDDDGLLAGFSQIPCPKNGDTEIECGRFYSMSERKIILVPVSQIRAKHQFDAFSAYRKFQIAEYYDLINESAYRREEKSQAPDYVTVSNRIEAEKAKGKKVSVAVRDFISGDIHEFPLDDELDINRLRELYHDTQQLLFLAR